MVTPNSKRASKAAKARASALTPERRSEIARNAANARKQIANVDAAEVPAATHRGPLKITDDFVLPSAVLSDGTRVISETGIAKQLGRGLGGKTTRLANRSGDAASLPVYLTTTLEPFVPESLRMALNNPIIYKDRGGLRRSVNATLLPEICEVWLKARDADALQPSQEHIAKKAEALMRALSRVGVIALVDEATGYQEVRDRNELQKILAAYIHGELLPWTKQFPDEFYEEMFRLRGWEFRPLTVKRPKLVGLLTNQLVYEKLPPGVLDELKARNPVISHGYRRHKFFQFLTPEIGNPHLAKQVAQVTALMRAATTWTRFKKMFDRVYGPKPEGRQVRLLDDGNEDDDD